MGTVDRTWRLYKESYNVLSADVEILLFPVMSAVAAIGVVLQSFRNRSSLLGGLLGGALGLGWTLITYLMVPVIVGVVYMLILAVVTSAVKGVFTAALYRYATSGQAPQGFSADLIQDSLTRGRPREWQ